MNTPRFAHFHRALVLTFALMIALIGLSAIGQADQLTLRHLYTVERYSGNTQFLTPTAVFLDANRQELYVCDSGTGRIITLTAATGEPLSCFSCRQKGQDSNSEPAGVAVDSKRRVFVADASVGRMYEYDYAGQPTGFIALPGSEDGRLPGKMAVDAADNLYVAVRNAEVVAVFDPEGHLKSRITSPSAQSMSEFCDVALGADGSIYALSRTGTAVHVFDGSGKFVREFGSHGPGKAGLAQPSGIDIDGKGRLWIADMISQMVKVLMPDGTFVETFGGLGTGPGDFFFPADVCIDRVANRLFVVEKAGQRLQAFAIEER
ncbi:MAG: NHL repeat-containing protein [Armatimonadota bacterium]